jgi:hypothetical protein
MAGCHIDDKALTFPVGDALKGISHDLMMPAPDKTGPHHLYELHIIVAGLLAVSRLIKAAQEFKDLRLFRVRDFRDNFRVIHAGMIPRGVYIKKDPPRGEP